MMLTFDAHDAAVRLEKMSAADVDALPFGVIRLSAEGRVVVYSRTEARQSGRGSLPTLGLDFFHDVAPCMNTDAFRGRIQADAARGRVDIEMGHTGDFADRSRVLRVRVLSADGGGFWLLHQRERLDERCAIVDSDPTRS